MNTHRETAEKIVIHVNSQVVFDFSFRQFVALRDEIAAIIEKAAAPPAPVFEGLRQMADPLPMTADMHEAIEEALFPAPFDPFDPFDPGEWKVSPISFLGKWFLCKDKTIGPAYVSPDPAHRWDTREEAEVFLQQAKSEKATPGAIMDAAGSPRLYADLHPEGQPAAAEKIYTQPQMDAVVAPPLYRNPANVNPALVPDGWRFLTVDETVIPEGAQVWVRGRGAWFPTKCAGNLTANTVTYITRIE